MTLRERIENIVSRHGFKDFSVKVGYCAQDIFIHYNSEFDCSPDTDSLASDLYRVFKKDDTNIRIQTVNQRH